MGLLILVALIAVPMIEIGLFIQVGGAIGLWPTLFIVVATAMAGTVLLRHQGLGALARLQQSLEQGMAPLEPVFDGFCLLAAGLLLLTPGFFTDGVGFLLFVPAVRRLLRQYIARRVEIHGAAASSEPFGGAHRPPPAGGPVIDGEWQDVTDQPDDDPRKPGSVAPPPTKRTPR